MSAIRFEIRPYATHVEGAWPRERRGFVIRIAGGASVGFGEAAPLPGYNVDTLEGCRSALDMHTADPRWVEAIASSNLPAIESLSLELAAQSPAAACGLEMAALDHIARRKNKSVGALLAGFGGVDALRRVPFNALIPWGDADQALEHAVQAFALGVRCVKLKVGRALEQELEAATAIHAAFGERMQLRLDANGAWTADQARENLARFAAANPEFCEQPVPAGQLATFQHSPIAWAADESCAHPELDTLLSDPPAQMAALVLKPMALGGGLRCLDLAKRAAAANVDLVVTHFLDGPLGVAFAAELAAALPGVVRTSGLDRHPGLRGWQVKLPQLSDHDAGSAKAPGLGLVIDRVPK